MRIEQSKKLVFILTFIILLFGGCTVYYSPERYANPRHKFESGLKKYDRRIRSSERKEIIDPLRWHH